MVKTFFEDKAIIKKVVISLIFVFMFNFMFGNLGNNIVFATEATTETTTETTEEGVGEVMEDEEIIEETGGGDLLLPIYKLLLFVSDSVLELLQKNLVSNTPVTISAASRDESNVNGWSVFWIGVGVVAAVAGVALCCTGIGSAAGVPALAAAASILGTSVLGACVRWCCNNWCGCCCHCTFN